MDANQNNVGRDFWLAWFLTSSLGYGIGAVLGLYFAYGVFNRDPFDIVMAVAFGTGMGATGGYFQWFLLRGWIAGAGVWGVASAFGFGLAMSVVVTVDTGQNTAMAGVLMVSIFGVTSGILQWLILRRKIAKAGWWLSANLLGSLVGAIAIPIATPLMDAGIWLPGAMTLGFVFGSGNGAITGAALVWLLRQSPSSNVEALVTAHQ